MRKKIKSLQAGRSYIQDVADFDVRNVINRKQLKLSTTFRCIQSVDAIIICVPTPLNRVKEPDLSFILEAINDVAKHINKNKIVILESTTYPGTTEEVILPKLENRGFKVGEDFYLCFSPERLDPGNKKFPFAVIPKVVGGITATCTQVGVALYSQIFYRVVPVSSSRTAEMTKLLENTFRIVNIGLVNELATIAERLGVDIWEAIDAAKTKPFGYMPFYPGPGVGGHCIGIDPIYLSWKAKTHGFNIRFIDLAREINTAMPLYVVTRIKDILEKKGKKKIKQVSILVVGVTYKPDVSDTRESPAFEIMERLLKAKARVAYHDPLIPTLKVNGTTLKSQAIGNSQLKAYDFTVIITHHSTIDYQKLVKHSRLILDTRNALKAFKTSKIFKL